MDTITGWKQRFESTDGYDNGMDITTFWERGWDITTFPRDKITRWDLTTFLGAYQGWMDYNVFGA